MNSLTTVDKIKIEQLKYMLDAGGTDAEFFVRFADAINKITNGTGEGKVVVIIKENMIALLKSEENRVFSDKEHMDFRGS